jgi:hypothetical protein
MRAAACSAARSAGDAFDVNHCSPASPQASNAHVEPPHPVSITYSMPQFTSRCPIGTKFGAKT